MMHVCLTDALEFLYGDSSLSKRSSGPEVLDVARGGIGSVHVLLSGLTAGGKLGLRVRRGGKAVQTDEWFRLIDVPVEANTGPQGFVEKEGEENTFAARRAPFRVYDAMEPIGRSVTASSPSTALRLHIPVSRNARAAAACAVSSRCSRRRECTISRAAMSQGGPRDNGLRRHLTSI